MNDMIKELFDVLDTEYRIGGIDARSYSTLKASLMVFRQRLESVDLVHAIDLYNAVKAVIDV